MAFAFWRRHGIGDQHTALVAFEMLDQGHLAWRSRVSLLLLALPGRRSPSANHEKAL